MSRHTDIHPAAELLEALISAEIRQADPSASPAVRAATPALWQQAHTLARHHGVAALAMNAIERLPDPLLPPIPLASLWMADAETVRRRNAAVDRAVVSLFAAMHAAGLSPVLVKGQGVACFYPDPSARQSGDIDIFLPAGPAAAAPFLKRRSIPAATHPDGSLSFVWQGVQVETHPRLIDIHSPAAARRLEALGTSASAVNILGAPIAVPDPETNLLLISAHIFKHAIGLGIGLRQFCDLAAATAALAHVADPARLQALITAAGLTRWHAVVSAMLSQSLGLTASLTTSSPTSSQLRLARRLHRNVLSDGNFGHSRRRGAFSTAFAFIARAPFSLAIAPREAVRCFACLAAGQKHRL